MSGRKNKIKSLCIAALAVMLAIVAGGFMSGCEDTVSLKLASQSAVLHIGETLTLDGKASDGSTIAYASTDEACASVSEDGVVIAKGEGSAVIIATAASAVAVCQVVVSGEIPIALTAIEIDSTLETGKIVNQNDAQLRYTLAPAQANNFHALQWHSSDAQVVSIDASGRIHARKVGRAIITLSAVGTDVQTTMDVEVCGRAPVLTLDHTEILGKTGEQLVLSSEIGGDFTAESVVFSSSDSQTAAVTEGGELTFVRQGTAIITCTAQFGGQTLTETCNVTVRDFVGYEIIRTPEQLAAIGNRSGNYALGNDIDMAQACAEGGICFNGGAGFLPLFNKVDALFTGVFDGCGFSIKNLMINRPSLPLSAFIVYIGASPSNYGVIKNLSLEGGSILGNKVAAFFANSIGSGTPLAGLENCYADITLKGLSIASGLCINLNGSVKNSLFVGATEGASTYAIAAMQSTVAAGRIFASFAQSGSASALHGLDASAVDAVSAFCSEIELQQSARYADWDEKIWLIEDGCVPMLKTPFLTDGGKT